jgi:CubicO group peptidase (beta-lactamase class C family)
MTMTRNVSAPAVLASPVDEDAVRTAMARVLTQWPSAGVAAAVVRRGQPTSFHAHGVADAVASRPVTDDTVFRIGSLTKPITAMAVMQLWEDGRIDLDAPANDYLKAFKLTTGRRQLRPATVRQLLTHTAGVGYWRRLSDLRRPGPGSGVQAQRLLPLSEYYGHGLPQEVEPGTKWVYSNHGFAALGQIVEDVTGQPLATVLRERLFDPLGMDHTDLVLSERVRPGLATGYVLRRRGLVPVVPREVPAPGSGGLYSTAGDLARLVAFLLEPGQTGVLEAATVATMFAPHYRPDPRVAGMGLGFDLLRESGVTTVSKGGTMDGFLSQLVLAPDEGTGLVVLTNTGGLSAQGAAMPLGTALLRVLLGLPEDPLRADIPPRPEVWSELCGWYAPAPGPVTNLFTRALMGAGAEVVIEHRGLLLKPLTPVPAMRKGMRLYPDDPDDPYAFRVDLSEMGMGTLPVVFTGPEHAGWVGSGPGFLMDLMDFHKRPDVRNPRRLVKGAVVAGGTAAVLRRLRCPQCAHEGRRRSCG